ncbi:MAG: hypothetical protein CMJ18_11375 [Phycisphaeraceae bacterium]|nr:hypothetical protein [Phycisphaeraceae bacterium]
MAASPDELIAEGLDHHRAGRHREAAQSYQRVLAVDPRNADALHLLGMVAQARGRYAAAIDHIQTAIKLRPGIPSFHNNLALAMWRHGMLDKAAEQCREALALRPDYPQCHNNLGNIRAEQDRLDDAVACYEQAIRLKPDHASAHHNLAVARLKQQRFDDAVRCCREAIRYQPGYAKAHFHLGCAQKALGHTSDALASFQTAVQHDDGDARAHPQLGLLRAAGGDLSGAEKSFQAAIGADRNMVESIRGLGDVYAKQRRLDAAEACYRRLPESADVLNELGSALRGQGRLTEAITCYRRALADDAGFVAARQNLANAFMDAGDLDEAIDAFRETLRIRPGYADAHSAMLFCMNHRPSIDPQELLGAHRDWASRHANPGDAPVRLDNEPDPQRRLRVGYVSPDFREHVVARFFEPILTNHDPEQVEAILYAQVEIEDEVSRKLKRLAGAWCPTGAMSDAELAARIRQDRVDVLVDLAGHTGGARLGAFAHRPAPVQVTYLGYPNTTGVDTIDYRLTDGVADPDDQDRWYVEKLVRLPLGFLCFAPPSTGEPPVMAPAFESAGHVTFGSFNRLSKINDEVVALWSRVLQSVEGSLLHVKSLSLNDPAIRQRMHERFERHGIARDRIVLLEYVHGRREHLATYGPIDIALDTLPYAGTTTTCEALWMGIPTVTQASEAHVGRVGMSVLHQVGLADLAAPSGDEFVRITTELAGDTDRLATLRRTLRDRMMASPLGDGVTVTRSIEDAYRTMWRTWCAAS